MADPVLQSHIFHIMGEMFDHATATFVSSKAAALIDAIKPIAIAGIGLFLTINGYMIMMGRVQEPFQDYLFKCAKIIFIAAFALNTPFYLSHVVDTINGLQSGLASALGSGDSSGSIFDQLDASLNQSFVTFQKAVEHADQAHWYQWSEVLRWYLVGALVVIATLAVVLVGGVIILTASLLLKFMLAIGPLFIMCLFWPITARYFETWFGQTIAYVLKIVAIALVLTVAQAIFSRIVAGNDPTAPGNNAVLMAIQILIAGLILYRAMSEIVSAMAVLSGGVSMAVMSLGQMAGSALAPGRAARSIGGAARNAVDPMSTRRDMQSGMMTTARRSNQLAAGNTMWNPAYRQHVLSNMGKNWGKARGGNVSQNK